MTNGCGHGCQDLPSKTNERPKSRSAEAFPAASALKRRVGSILRKLSKESETFREHLKDVPGIRAMTVGEDEGVGDVFVGSICVVVSISEMLLE